LPRHDTYCNGPVIEASGLACVLGGHKKIGKREKGTKEG